MRSLSFLFSLHSRAGNWATSANKPDPPSNPWTVILHKAYSWYSNGRDTALWLHLHPAFLHSQQHLVRRQECCLSRLVCNSGFEYFALSNGKVFWAFPTCCLFSFRSHQMYYMFGFLFLVFIILLITCSEATILLCYFHLCAEVLQCSWNSVSLIKLESGNKTNSLLK